jgi:hypothetical protein
MKDSRIRGSKDSSKMLKNYGDLGYAGKERLQKLRTEIEDVERMLKALIKSLKNNPLDP